MAARPGRAGGASRARQHVPPNPTPAQTRKKKAAFLVAFRASGVVSVACRAARIGRTTHYDWLKEDPEYTKQFNEALEDAVDVAEEELRRRAIDGIDEPVFYQGDQVATVRKKSDTCLIFYLKGRRKDVFAERHEVTGKDGGEIKGTFNLRWME